MTAALSAQDYFDGQWQTTTPGQRGTDVVLFDFKTDGTKLTGVIRRNQPAQSIPVEGTVDKQRIEFVVSAGNKTITFQGKLAGDRIEFTRDAKGTAGPQDGAGTGIFGLNGPKTFVAIRAKSVVPPTPGTAGPAVRGTVPQPNIPVFNDLGTWQTSVPGSLVMDLRSANGTRLLGDIRRIEPCCSQNFSLEGTINGDQISFAIQNGSQVVSFSGRIQGNGMTLTTNQMNGVAPVGGGIFGSSAIPATLSAKRVR